MRWTRVLARALAGLVLAGATAMAAGAGDDPILGTWKTTPGAEGGRLLVRMAPCGDRFCGTITQAVDRNGVTFAGYPHLGREMVSDMRAEGEGRYSGGRIWSPDENRSYALRLTLTGEGLAVRGCMLGICRDAGVWTRAD